MPQITFSNAFDYETFKNALINGSFGDVIYYQASPAPLACPQIKTMCEDLDQKISNINSFKTTEEQQQKKLSSRLNVIVINCIQSIFLVLPLDRFTFTVNHCIWSHNTVRRGICLDNLQLSVIRGISMRELTLNSTAPMPPRTMNVSPL